MVAGTPTDPAAPPMFRETTLRIQRALADQGHYSGPLDGLFGPATEAAAAAWAAAKGGAAPAAVERPRAAATIRQGASGYLVSEIVVHCSDTRQSWMGNATLAEQVDEIRRWHMQDRHWADIGYHWVIGRGGPILPGRPETRVGAGVEGHNSGVIHICLIGGHGSAESDPFARHFTPAQDAALRAKLDDIRARTPVRRISGHNEWAAKACPGFNVPAWLRSL